MKRITYVFLLALLLIITMDTALAQGQDWHWFSMPTVPPHRLSGIKVGIDPGHQAHQNSQKEAVAPGSSETKMKASSGTEGVRSGVEEYVVNLQVGLKLRSALEELGCEVNMTRTTNDVDISNQERAKMMNALGVDLVLRLHCDGADNSKANGVAMYVNETGPIAYSSQSAAAALLPAMVAATGARDAGIHLSDSYTGNNWSEVPCVMVEMGFMSNPEEDMRLVSDGYQDLLVRGMVNGILDWFGR